MLYAYLNIYVYLYIFVLAYHKLRVHIFFKKLNTKTNIKATQFKLMAK